VTPLADCFPATRQYQASRRQLRSAGHGSAALTAALDAGEILRLRRGVYALAPLPVRARHLLTDGVPDAAYLAATRALIIGLGKGIAADRRTAAVFWGMDMLVEPSKVELRVPHGRVVDLTCVDARPSRMTAQLDHEVLGFEGIPITGEVDTVLDCALARPMRESVVIADSALRRGLVTLDDLVAGVAVRARHPESARLRRLLHLIDDQSGSVLESVLRFLLLQHGYTPQSQFTVMRGNLFVGRFDFCLAAAHIIIECDGRRWHDPEDAREKDRQKTNALTRMGWRVLRFSWAEVIDSPAYVLACIEECEALAA
jgi:very-short-patch-repair endonuclease